MQKEILRLKEEVKLIVMCKSPVKGKVKTRLMTTYSAQEAMQWHQAMATTVIQRAQRLFPKVMIAVDDVSHPFFTRFDAEICSQGEGDLGERMRHVMQQFCKQGEAVMFLGTDSPHMLDERLKQAEQALNTHDIVLGAVEDGGYDLIAMRQAYPDMLKGMDWGTEKVLAQSIEKAKRLALSYQLLDVSFDVDTPDMLSRAIKMGWHVTHEGLD
ncbi:MAG: TIGR04282 family arsenosugar biosynthesis glycosyltransferase [Mariprofundaceae bacterium]|nr:TIGR04282 family arsenosugar biosynthesis glycosyltransferase [Mariprofundaceae bacterium]